MSWANPLKRAGLARLQNKRPSLAHGRLKTRGMNRCWTRPAWVPDFQFPGAGRIAPLFEVEGGLGTSRAGRGPEGNVPISISACSGPRCCGPPPEARIGVTLMGLAADLGGTRPGGLITPNCGRGCGTSDFFPNPIGDMRAPGSTQMAAARRTRCGGRFGFVGKNRTVGRAASHPGRESPAAVVRLEAMGALIKRMGSKKEGGLDASFESGTGRRLAWRGRAFVGRKYGQEKNSGDQVRDGGKTRKYERGFNGETGRPPSQITFVVQV